MPLDLVLNGQSGRMLKVAVAAELIYQLGSFNLSSPQTAELNAGARAPTIGKWVRLTVAEGGAWIVLLCMLDESLWPLLGGGIALGGAWFKYRYAIKAGLDSNAPATENYAA